MPEASTMREFLDARQTGKTNTCKNLDALFANPNALGGHALFGWLNTPRVLDQPLPPLVRAFLSTAPQNLKDEELDHIDDWPANLKERVRRKLVEAIQDPRNRDIDFRWKLHQGTTEETDMWDPDEQGRITITFRSPWNNVFISPDGEEVNVVVGP